MAYDSTPTPPTAWTTADELSADQRSRYGDYVAAKDQVRADCEANRKRNADTEAAMAACAGNTLAALALMLGAA